MFGKILVQIEMFQIRYKQNQTIKCVFRVNFTVTVISFAFSSAVIKIGICWKIIRFRYENTFAIVYLNKFKASQTKPIG